MIDNVLSSHVSTMWHRCSFRSNMLSALSQDKPAWTSYVVCSSRETVKTGRAAKSKCLVYHLHVIRWAQSCWLLPAAGFLQRFLGPVGGSDERLTFSVQDVKFFQWWLLEIKSLSSVRKYTFWSKSLPQPYWGRLQLKLSPNLLCGIMTTLCQV